MKLAEGNVKSFNERARTLVNELASVGQSVNNNDLLNLMKGYGATPDKLFSIKCRISTPGSCTTMILAETWSKS